MYKKLSSYGKPTAVLVAELDDLSFSLTKKLLQQSCKIFLVTNNPRKWMNIFKGPIVSGGLSIINKKQISDIEGINYMVYHFNFYKTIMGPASYINNKINKDVRNIFKELYGFKGKKVMLLPALAGITPDLKGQVVRKVYFRETFGPHMVIDKNYFVFSLLAAVAKGDPIQLPKVRDEIRLADSELVADEILKYLFSFSSAYEITLLGTAYTPENFIDIIDAGSLLNKTGPKKYKRLKISTYGKEIILDGLEGIKETLNYLKSGIKNHKSYTLKKTRLLKRLAIFVLILFFVPFVSLLLSAITLGFSFYLIKGGNITMAKTSFVGSHNAAKVARVGFGLLMQIPIISPILSLPNSTSGILERAARIGEGGTLILDEAKTLVSYTLGDKQYKPSDFTGKISREMDFVYQESGLILGELYSNKFLSNLLFRWVKEDALLEIRTSLLPTSKLIKNLPTLLGETKSKRYLILFQNSAELRPAGGFIGSFAITTFEGGRLADLVIWDVFEADGQLKGHVEPPSPLKLYLGQASWFLRDSNWDPDFRFSAARAEWFLDKEIDQEVDGVIGVDPKFVNDLLLSLGPIYLSDYKQEINNENFFEVTQKEVEENFFPGSTKKSNYLTALASALRVRIKEKGKQETLSLGIPLLNNLKERHIQVYTQEINVADALSDLGWDGGMQISTCGENCYSDMTGIIEANLGVNKVNNYIDRSIKLKVTLGQGKITRELSLLLNNSADTTLGAKGIYKVYARVFAPKTSLFQKVKLSRGKQTIEVEPELGLIDGRQEAGVLATIPPQSRATLTYIWESPTRRLDFNKQGGYELMFRKQAGTDKDPIVIEISGPRGKNQDVFPTPSLTREGANVYNTLLARDFVSRVSW